MHCSLSSIWTEFSKEQVAPSHLSRFSTKHARQIKNMYYHIMYYHVLSECKNVFLFLELSRWWGWHPFGPPQSGEHVLVSFCLRLLKSPAASAAKHEVAHLVHDHVGADPCYRLFPLAGAQSDPPDLLWIVNSHRILMSRKRCTYTWVNSSERFKPWVLMHLEQPWFLTSRKFLCEQGNPVTFRSAGTHAVSQAVKQTHLIGIPDHVLISYCLWSWWYVFSSFANHQWQGN